MRSLKGSVPLQHLLDIWLLRDCFRSDRRGRIFLESPIPEPRPITSTRVPRFGPFPFRSASSSTPMSMPETCWFSRSLETRGDHHSPSPPPPFPTIVITRPTPAPSDNFLCILQPLHVSSHAEGSASPARFVPFKVHVCLTRMVESVSLTSASSALSLEIPKVRGLVHGV